MSDWGRGWCSEASEIVPRPPDKYSPGLMDTVYMTCILHCCYLYHQTKVFLCCGIKSSTIALRVLFQITMIRFITLLTHIPRVDVTYSLIAMLDVVIAVV